MYVHCCPAPVIRRAFCPHCGQALGCPCCGHRTYHHCTPSWPYRAPLIPPGPVYVVHPQPGSATAAIQALSR